LRLNLKFPDYGNEFGLPPAAPRRRWGGGIWRRDLEKGVAYGAHYDIAHSLFSSTAARGSGARQVGLEK